MSSRDMHNNIKPFVAFAEAAITAAATLESTGEDTANFQSLEFILNWIVVSSVSVDADTTIVKLEDSDDNVVFADVDSTFVLGTPLATGIPVADLAYRIGYVGKRQFVRLSITAPTGTNDYTITSYVIKGVALNNPTTAAV